MSDSAETKAKASRTKGTPPSAGTPRSDGEGAPLPPAAVYLNIATLNPWPDNPRDLTDSVPVIKRSLKAFGFGRPLIAWGEGAAHRIVVGHGTREAYLQLLKEDPTWQPGGVPARGLVPVRWRDDWTEAEAAGYALADNRTAEFSMWDDEKLRGVIAGLGDAVFLPDMGWDPDDLNALLAPPDDDDDPAGGGVPNVIVQYNIVFDNEAQQTTWYKFVRWLKRNADGETIGARLDHYVSGVLTDDEPEDDDAGEEP